MQCRVSVVIPALNEAESIGVVVRAVLADAKAGPRSEIAECIVVDNGSTDGTAEAARAAGARVVISPRGYGAACAAGAKAAVETSDVLVFLDGDGSDDVSAMAQMVGPIERGEAAFVIGSRMRGKAEPGSLNGAQVFAAQTHRRAGEDDCMGFDIRIWGRFARFAERRWKRMQMREMTYGWNLEMQVKAVKMGLRVVEIPVDYRCRIGGESKVSGNFGRVRRRREDSGCAGEGAVVKKCEEPLVELEHVNVARGNSVVLHDVSLRVERGEHLAILGPNGCGKSTLLKTMTCEIYPSCEAGDARAIMGRERWDLTQLKRRMGVVSAGASG